MKNSKTVYPIYLGSETVWHEESRQMAFYSPFRWDKKGKGSLTIYFGLEFCINEYASRCTTFPALRNSMPLTQALKCATLAPSSLPLPGGYSFPHWCSMALHNPEPHNRWKCWVTSLLLSQQRTPVKSWTKLRCKKSHEKHCTEKFLQKSLLYLDTNLKPGKFKFKHPWTAALMGSA